MKGLILKELWVLRKQLGLLLALCAFYLVFAVLTGNYGIFGGIIILVAVLFPITSLAYDERGKWDRYVPSLSISRRDFILAKYTPGILLNLVAMAAVYTAFLILTPFLANKGTH